MESYRSWIRGSITGPLSAIDGLSERVSFLRKEKAGFILMGNTGTEAREVLLYIDTLIDQNQGLLIEQQRAEDKSPKEKAPRPQEVKEDCEDFFDNTIAERIVMMQVLGVLDYLEKKLRNETIGRYFSVNLLAAAISSFTGVNKSTLQSYLNHLYGGSTDKSKSPLTSKNKRAAKSKAEKLGFKID